MLLKVKVFSVVGYVARGPDDRRGSNAGSSTKGLGKMAAGLCCNN